MNKDRSLVVLTPVKNEAWILPLFLRATSLWADYIIVADQDSTDGSLDIYQHYPKVVVIHNDSKDLDEGFRDNLMLNKAREIAGTNAIIFRIDADELLAPYFDSEDWKQLLESEPGSVWTFQLANIGKDYDGYSMFDGTYGAFVDDGRDYQVQGLIHNRAMFSPSDGSEPRLLKNMPLMHFQFVDWARMESKHRWYQCFEKINYPKKSAIEIYRLYHWMYDKNLFNTPIPLDWFEKYKAMGVDLHSIQYGYQYKWDERVSEYVDQYGSKFFKNIDTNRPKRLKKMGRKSLLVYYLDLSKYFYNHKQGIAYKLVRKTDTFLRVYCGL